MSMMRRRERPEYEPAEFNPQDLTGLFAPPRWLRDLGSSAWLGVGVTLFVIAVMGVLTLTQTIVAPVLAASVIAAVASPVVRWLSAHRLNRGIAAALILVAVIVLAFGVASLVFGGITSQKEGIRTQLSDAKDTLANWTADAGVDEQAVADAKEDVSDMLNDAVPALLEGIASGITRLSSLAFFLSLTALSLFFLLKDGPLIRDWVERRMRVPKPVAHDMMHRVLESMRGYFTGVTFVALFNAVVVGLGAVLLGVPLAGTIAAITFVGAYVPYLGAWGAGAFSVLMALGGAGSDAAAGMIIVQLLANGILQQMIQPIAYGAALGIHPLAVLIVTIGGGALFGAVGLVLAAPLTSAATKIAADLTRNRETAGASPAAPAAT
jgi:predicted PurR-regulated permease PerM